MDSENSRDSFFRGISGKEWVVYCKEPFDNPNNLIEYLGRYTHRIIEVTENTVSFYYKDYRDNKQKVMTLEHEEFIRRFLQHVVPSGFMRIRYSPIYQNKQSP
ncbi:MAG: transposase [Leptospiraceae bacterium]|nr:transposase [Leptospiraceae bacterium]MCP5497790.1 transposase [Leptospiraceae bacterium]